MNRMMRICTTGPATGVDMVAAVVAPNEHRFGGYSGTTVPPVPSVPAEPAVASVPPAPALVLTVPPAPLVAVGLLLDVDSLVTWRPPQAATAPTKPKSHAERITFFIASGMVMSARFVRMAVRLLVLG